MAIVQIFRSALPARAGTGPLKSGSARPAECVHACMCDQLLSRVWLFCDPRDCSLPDSSVHGVFQARILDCISMSSCRGPFWPRDRTQVSCNAGKFFITEAPGKPRPLDLPQQRGPGTQWPLTGLPPESSELWALSCVLYLYNGQLSDVFLHGWKDIYTFLIKFCHLTHAIINCFLHGKLTLCTKIHLT